MLRCYLPLTLTLVALVVPTGAYAADAPRRPNVILIFADDLGSLDLNCYGSKDLHTPNLDGLAQRGVRFSQFYVAAPVCSPSRAALLTGRFPQRAGVPGNVSSRPNEPGLPPDEVTIAEMLKQAGYRTALIGKWHLGTRADSDPLAQGFDEFFGHKAGCIDNYSHFFYWQGPPYHDLWRNRQEHHEDGAYFTDLVAQEARRFLEENKARPFFLYLPFNSPHYPMQAPERFRKMYEKMPEPRRSYAAMVSALDAAVGSVLAKLDELKLREDTIVIFLSDHGHSTEERCNFGGGNPGPFRGAKFSLFEGGVRVPCIASWPGHFPENQERKQPAISIDWLPTIAEACRAKLPRRRIDGRSLLPVIHSADAAPPHAVLYWQLGEQYAVRDGDWKLVVNANDTKAGTKVRPEDRVFLSNLATDATERNNLAARHPEVVERLQRLHREWAAELKAK